MQTQTIVQNPVRFNLNRSIEILERTPSVLESLLKGLSDEWIMTTEGKDSWSPFDVVGHLIQGEKTDWIPRMEIILSKNNNKTFEPFDMQAHFHASRGKTINELIAEFKLLRARNIQTLKSKAYSEDILLKTGIHPEFGTVTLKQHLATWVVHDLSHIAQISRVMARQYTHEVGPWRSYHPILGKV